MTDELILYHAVTACRTWMRRGADPSAAAWRAATAHGLSTADEARVMQLAATAEAAFEAWRAATDISESATNEGNEK